MSTPKAGVTYVYDAALQAFTAPGREPLPTGPAGWVEPAPMTVGSLPVGSATYGVPDSGQVLFVSPSGSDSAAGTLAAPKQTLAGALSAVNASFGAAFIVMRAGTYHESLTVSKAVTIQAYPSEAVWLDGSSAYSSWTGSGPWTAPLGVDWAPVSTTGYPLTTYAQGNLPEQVWIDDVAQLQVADGATPAAGQFSVNRTAHTVTIGTDPSGKQVRVAELNTALTVSAQVKLYGFGIRRYSPLVQEGLSGLVYFGGTSQGSTVENMVFQDCYAVGLVSARALTVRDITVQDCGGAGMQVTTASGFSMERFVIRRCNRNLWKAQPITAGIKVTRTEGILLKDGLVSDIPDAMGVWFDVSVTKSIVANVAVDGTTVMSAPVMQLGLHSELSDGGLYSDGQHTSWYVNCRVTNTKHGIKFLDAGHTTVANCKVDSYSSVGIYLQQDERRNSGTSNLDPNVVPWVGRGTGLLNNDIGPGPLQVIAYHDPPTGDPLLLGWDFFARIAGNWMRTLSSGSMFQLGKADGARSSYNTLAALAASPSTVGSSVGKLGTNYVGTVAPADATAEALPGDIAALLGIPRGLQRVGPILPAPVASF